MMLGAASADAVSHNHLAGTATERITFDATGPLRHLMYEQPGQDPSIAILFVASLFRDVLPWIYELGIEAYRALRDDRSNAQKMLSDFTRNCSY